MNVVTRSFTVTAPQEGTPGKMKNKKRVCTKCFEKEILQILNCVLGRHMNKPTKWLFSSQRIKSSFDHGKLRVVTMVFKSFSSTLCNVALFIMQSRSQG